MFSSVRSASQPLDPIHHVMITRQENALNLRRSSLAIKVKVYPKAICESVGEKVFRLVKPDEYLSYTLGGKANYESFEKCLGRKVS